MHARTELVCHNTSWVKHFVLVMSMLLLQSCGAQQIVEFSTKITFTNSTTKNDTTVKMQGLSMYQDYEMYGMNQTLASNQLTNQSSPGQDTVVLMCFIDDSNGKNFDKFLSECKNNQSAPNNTQWILVSVALEDKD